MNGFIPNSSYMFAAPFMATQQNSALGVQPAVAQPLAFTTAQPIDSLLSFNTGLQMPAQPASTGQVDMASLGQLLSTMNTLVSSLAQTISSGNLFGSTTTPAIQAPVPTTTTVEPDTSTTTSGTTVDTTPTVDDVPETSPEESEIESGTSVSTPEPDSNSGSADTTKHKKVAVRLVEAGTNGAPDTHSSQVKEVLMKNAGDKVTADTTAVTGDELPEGAVKQPDKIETAKDLNTLIDADSTYLYSAMTKEVKQAVKDGKKVVNGSLSWSKDASYLSVIKALKQNPKLASAVGLKASDLNAVQLSPDGSVNQASLPANVKKSVANYVDRRLDASNSKFSQARTTYQTAMADAAEKGVVVVVAAGNEGDDRKILSPDRVGSDTNFLAESKNVISVAASDTRGTKDLKDDTVADFSSAGVDDYNPTVATDGVNIKTAEGTTEGTSFSSPKVAATVSQMLSENPNLSFAEIKSILQSTATDTGASKSKEGAGMLDVDKAINKAKTA